MPQDEPAEIDSIVKDAELIIKHLGVFQNIRNVGVPVRYEVPLSAIQAAYRLARHVLGR